MQNIPWSPYIFLVPCILQIFLNFLEFKRTKFKGKLVGLTGFILISLGVIFLIILTQTHPNIDRQLAANIYRVTVVGGATLWLVDQLLWLRLRVRVI